MCIRIVRYYRRGGVVARLFFSYHTDDRPIARVLEKGLKEKGHQSVWGVDELIAGRGWGELMPRRLAEADAVVALLTENSRSAPSVLCEIGAARALAIGPKRVALLPVVIGLQESPFYARDILVLRGKPEKEQGFAGLIDEIDRAILAHLETLRNEADRASYPKIFISHRHKDHEIARALAETLSAAFEIATSDIRCTSVQPYRLPFGQNTGERLRDEIRHARAVLGILAPDTSESAYVMFELGAAWAERIYTCPLLSRGASYADIPGPIFDLSPARLWVDSDSHQLLRDLETEVELKRRRDTQGQVSDKITALVRASTAPAREAGA